MFSIRISNRKSETKLLWPVLLCILGCRLAGALSHMNDNATFFEAHFIHERFHQVDSTSMNEPDVFGAVGSATLLVSNPCPSSFTVIDTSSGSQRQVTWTCFRGSSRLP